MKLVVSECLRAKETRPDEPETNSVARLSLRAFVRGFPDSGDRRVRSLGPQSRRCPCGPASREAAFPAPVRPAPSSRPRCLTTAPSGYCSHYLTLGGGGPVFNAPRPSFLHAAARALSNLLLKRKPVLLKIPQGLLGRLGSP